VTRHAGTAGGVFDPPAAPRDQTRRRAAPGTYWRSPPGIVMLAATGLALAIRLYLLGRPGYLSGLTEYDDGVYLGGAISLISGSAPYHDFAFVQPPGILLLMAPVALIAKVSAPAVAMAAARLLTAAASAACVGLVGALVRHRGTAATLVACGSLALYPDDIMSAHTLLLEPWMNLLVLSGTCLVFRDGAFLGGVRGDGRFAAAGRLLYAGILFGLACAVKYWAVIPAACMIAACVCARPDGTPANEGRPPRPASGRAARTGWFSAGTLAGFAVPVLPFAARWPGRFLRSTVLDQASRTGSAVPESLRLAHLTGLSAVLSDAGRLTVSGNEATLFARDDVTAASTWATGWLPVALAVVVAGLLGLCYAVGRSRARRTRPGEVYALAVLGCTLVAVLGYSAFFYHYADLPAPWLAITAGFAAAHLVGARTARLPPTAMSRLRERQPGSRKRRRRRGGLTAWLAAGLVLVAAFEAWELSGLRAPSVNQDAALIPPGACVVSDEVSLSIAADRFTTGVGGCPDVLDSLATTLVAGNGVSVEGGARALPQVAAAWQGIFTRARYVWLSGSSNRRIPWTADLRAWFARNFKPLHPPAGQRSEGQVYVRRDLPSPLPISFGFVFDSLSVLVTFASRLSGISNQN
jgi:hypothetical protein